MSTFTYLRNISKQRLNIYTVRKNAIGVLTRIMFSKIQYRNILKIETYWKVSK